MFPKIRALPSLRFVCEQTGSQFDNFTQVVENLPWDNLIPENFEFNTLKGDLYSNEWRMPIRGIQVLYPGMHWDDKERSLRVEHFMPCKQTADKLDDFINTSANFFERLNGKSIGVQLSGGLDSSLIIGILTHLAIPFSLVGMSSERYEFRTERYIQKILSEQCGKCRLINYEEHLPLSNLNLVPAHEYADVSIMNFSADCAMAKSAAELGVEVLLCGNGGDVILGTAVPAEMELCLWQPQKFTYPWPKDIVYSSHNVEIKSFFEDYNIVNCLYQLRKGQRHDPEKRWARSFFRVFLPRELSDYTYCADFWGIYIDGLLDARSQITELHEKAYQITRNSYFHNEKLSQLLAKDLLLKTEKILYQKIESRAALSAWIVSLQEFRNAHTLTQKINL